MQTPQPNEITQMFRRWSQGDRRQRLSGYTRLLVDGCQGERSYALTVGGGGGAVTGLQYYPLPRPIRALDTRPGESACNAPGVPLANQGTFNLIARGNCDGVTIPANAQAVVGNATVVNFISGGDLITLFPSDAPLPNASNLNFTANQITPNSFTVGLGGDGSFKIFSHAATHFIVDITGYVVSHTMPPLETAAKTFWVSLTSTTKR